jgi:transketolase
MSDLTIGTRPLDAKALRQRRALLDMLAASRRGHISSALSVIDIVRTLYDHVLRFDPRRPDWRERDRFILSKGHGCMALYVVLAEHGFFPVEELSRFTRFDSILGSHPDMEKVPGVEASTGSLGHGLSIGVGMALAGRMDGADYRTFVVVGDGECNEGSVWEAALSAAHHGLEKLTVLVDYNKMQCWSRTSEVLELEPLAAKWEAFGFGVRQVDGHDPEALRSALELLPYRPGRPSCLICHTVKGRGVAEIENNPLWHHANRLGDEAVARLYEDLDAANRP